MSGPERMEEETEIASPTDDAYLGFRNTIVTIHSIYLVQPHHKLSKWSLYIVKNLSCLVKTENMCRLYFC